MRKILSIILFLSLAVLSKTQAQMPVIKPMQYTIIVDRIVMNDGTECMKWVLRGNTPIDNFLACTPDNNYCLTVDPTCNNCTAPDLSKIELYTAASPLPIATSQVVNMKPLALGARAYYSDTFQIYQAQFPITRIDNVIDEIDVWHSYGNPNFTTECYPFHSSASLVPTGEYFDKEFTVNSNFNAGLNYGVTARVRIIPNLDPTFTLPSHDQILISQTNTSFTTTPVWEYQDTLSGSWHQISPSFTSNNGNLLKISGLDILGSNYVNLLHSTIKFRVRNSSGSLVSEIVPFTLRLSSPHIVSVTPTHLDCFERNEGTVKIQFDRMLLEGERLNILMYDTTHQVSYSALNMSALASDSTYTWPTELGAGLYHLTLLGKYAKGIVYDLYTSERVDTVAIYTALNSVNFEDGFNTPDIDNFDAYTDYTGYAQATYTGSLTHMSFQTVTQPAKIRFVARVDNMVLCKGMPSGSITLAADGGKANFKYSLKHKDSTNWSPWGSFSNNSFVFVYMPEQGFFSPQGVHHWVSNLYAGQYQLRVRDMVDCYAKDSAGNEVTYKFTITEPEKGITVDLLEISPITSVDSANGRIKVHISGGTPFVSGEITYWPYDITWKDSTGQDISFTRQTLEANKRMETITGLLPDGLYTLRVFDAWHGAAAPNNAGCYLELKIPMRKPAPLLVNIQTLKQVTCYDSANAELLAKVSGGIPIDSLKYTFKWYRINGGNTLLPVTDSIIKNLGPGDYQVEVTDKYDNKKMSQPFTLTQPSRIQLQMNSTQASCYSTNDGTASVQVTGGTPYAFGYKYEWSTGDRTPLVDSIPGGNYLVVVTDSMFCISIDTVSVTSPLQVIPEVTVNPVTCRGACDGQISVTATGGSGVYTWLWSNGATTSGISNLCAGTYWFRVTDVSGCSESDTITLDEPDTLFVNLGADRKICIGQTIRLNATASDTAVLTYSWTGSNGFTANTAKVNITQPGTYQVAVSNIRGCVVRDTITVIAENSTINTDFVVSTQAFVNEPVTLVNISQPRTDSVRWIVPSLGNVIRVTLQNNDRCELIFSDTGRYAITMRAYYPSGCIEDSTKIVNVIPQSGPITGGNPGNAFLKAYAVIYPNPNTGTFKVDLKFSEVTKARLRLINTLTNIIMDDRLVQGFKDYLLDYNMSPLTNGVYILVIEAAKGSFVYKVIIAH